MYRSAYSDKYFDDLAILPAALKSYIPEQLLKNVNMKKISGKSSLQYVQSVLDNSNGNLRMYGSAEILMENLQNYMNFPLRRKMFPQRIPHYENTIPEPYRNLKGEVLYCKQDYLFHLQSWVYSEFQLWDADQSSEYAELIDYMKKHEKRLSGCYEFLKNDYEIFANIWKFFNAELVQVIPKNGKMTGEQFQRAAYKEKDFVKVFDTLISKYPCIFLPNSETRDKNAAAVVRVFDDKNTKFVMESELFAAINLKNSDRKPLECTDTKGQYRIIEYKRVLELYRDQITDIDFIHHPIESCLHRAVPIVAPTGDHCILSADALLDILKDTFQVLGVFQKLTRNTCHMIPKFIAVLEKYFPSNIKYRYFINLKVLQNIRKELEEFWKPIEDVPVKKVRNVGPNGFTVEDLKKELEYLGYTEIFYEISSEARNILSKVQLQESTKLDTRGMFVAIECCLMSVMFKRFPYFENFMIRQKVCIHNRAKPCESCLRVFEEAEKEAESEQDFQNALGGLWQPVLEAVLTILKDKSQRCEELETTIKKKDEEIHEKSGAEKYRNQEKEDLKATVIKLHQQLKDKDQEIKELKKANLKSEKSKVEELKKVNNSLLELEKRVSQGSEQLKNKDSRIQELLKLNNSQIIKEKNEEIEKLRKQQASMAKENEKEIEQLKRQHVLVAEENKKEIEQLKRNASKSADDAKKLIAKIAEKEAAEKRLKRSLQEVSKKSSEAPRVEEIEKLQSSFMEQLKNKDSIIQELELKNSKLSVEKNEEIERLQKQQELLAKENKMEIEQSKLNASKSADEIKKLTAKISEKEVAENRLKESINELYEILRKSDFNLQEITKKYSHLDAEIADKNRIIQELRKSAEKEAFDQEKAKEELETAFSMIRGVLNRNSPPEPKEKPYKECLICFEEMKPNQKTLKCEHCRKIVHLECASKWLKIHRSCVHCRREQLDPNEFPSLQ